MTESCARGKNKVTNNATKYNKGCDIWKFSRDKNSKGLDKRNESSWGNDSSETRETKKGGKNPDTNTVHIYPNKN